MNINLEFNRKEGNTATGVITLQPVFRVEGQVRRLERECHREEWRPRQRLQPSSTERLQAGRAREKMEKEQMERQKRNYTSERPQKARKRVFQEGSNRKEVITEILNWPFEELKKA